MDQIMEILEIIGAVFFCLLIFISVLVFIAGLGGSNSSGVHNPKTPKHSGKRINATAMGVRRVKPGKLEWKWK